MATLLSKKDQMSRSDVASEMLPRKCCLEYELKTLGLLLRRPNITLVIVRPLIELTLKTPTTMLPTHK